MGRPSRESFLRAASAPVWPVGVSEHVARAISGFVPGRVDGKTLSTTLEMMVEAMGMWGDTRRARARAPETRRSLAMAPRILLRAAAASELEGFKPTIGIYEFHGSYGVMHLDWYTVSTIIRLGRHPDRPGPPPRWALEVLAGAVRRGLSRAPGLADEVLGDPLASKAIILFAAAAHSTARSTGKERSLPPDWREVVAAVEEGLSLAAEHAGASGPHGLGRSLDVALLGIIEAGRILGLSPGVAALEEAGGIVAALAGQGTPPRGRGPLPGLLGATVLAVDPAGPRSLLTRRGGLRVTVDWAPERVVVRAIVHALGGPVLATSTYYGNTVQASLWGLWRWREGSPVSVVASALAGLAVGRHRAGIVRGLTRDPVIGPLRIAPYLEVLEVYPGVLEGKGENALTELFERPGPAPTTLADPETRRGLPVTRVFQLVVAAAEQARSPMEQALILLQEHAASVERLGGWGNSILPQLVRIQRAYYHGITRLVNHFLAGKTLPAPAKSPVDLPSNPSTYALNVLPPGLEHREMAVFYAETHNERASEIGSSTWEPPPPGPPVEWRLPGRGTRIPLL